MYLIVNSFSHVIPETAQERPGALAVCYGLNQS